MAIDNEVLESALKKAGFVKMVWSDFGERCFYYSLIDGSWPAQLLSDKLDGKYYYDNSGQLHPSSAKKGILIENIEQLKSLVLADMEEKRRRITNHEKMIKSLT